MGESASAADRFRGWLGARAFRLTCWLYRLPRDRTFLETDWSVPGGENVPPDPGKER